MHDLQVFTELFDGDDIDQRSWVLQKQGVIGGGLNIGVS